MPSERPPRLGGVPNAQRQEVLPYLKFVWASWPGRPATSPRASCTPIAHIMCIAYHGQDVKVYHGIINNNIAPTGLWIDENLHNIG
jgi:hypothetical protein